MKFSWTVHVVVLAFLTTSQIVAAETASIEGRVQNAVTGQYLTNARVSISGTSRLAYTDQAGSFRFTQVPSGEVTVVVFYTGLDLHTATLKVQPGQVHRMDASLSNRSLYGESDVVKLDSFVVTTARATDVATIAINEQRNAPNIKNVIAGDAFGDVLDGNVGEFLKFLPGVSAEYDFEAAGAVAAVSVRGFASNLTVVTADGAQMANPGTVTGDSRSFHFGSISMNNVSRVELTKVPTPSMAADSMAGSVNMVSKSAFERKRAEFNYSISLSADSRYLKLSRQPAQSDQMRHKVRPGFTFDYTLPVNDRLGLVATGSYIERYVLTHGTDPKTYNTTGAGTNASTSSPYMQSYRLTRHERFDVRSSFGLRADYKIARHAVLTVSGQTSTFQPDRDPYDIIWNAGNNGTPTLANGVPMAFGPTFTEGATGRGSVTMQSTSGVDQYVDSHAGSTRFKFDDGNWRFETGFNYSRAKLTFHDLSHRQFRQFGITMMNPVRVSFADISPDRLRPGVIRVFDNNNREVDLSDVNNWRLNTANSTPRSTADTHRGIDLSVRRAFDLARVPVALQAGGMRSNQIRDFRFQNNSWTYNGPDGNPTTPDTPAPFLNSTFVGQDVAGLKSIPWVSRRKAYEEWQKNPSLFTSTPAQLVTNEQNRINNSKHIEETRTAGYLQGEARFLENKLSLLSGVRYEHTETTGEGVLFDPSAVFQRTATGSFLRNAAGARIRKPEAGAAGSLDELRLIRRERAYKAGRSYDGLYPSLHVNYNVAKDVVARFAYARTFGRPNFREIIPNANVSEADLDADTADPSLLRGRLSITNPGLQPWTADNFDLSLEYYTPHGGLFSGGVFRKDIDNFFGTAVAIASPDALAALDLDSRYAGWELTRTVNAGSARISGVEFNIMHPLKPLGEWARPFQAFLGGSSLDLKGGDQADFSNFVKHTLNWGLTYARKPFTVRAKWNYRGERQVSPVAALGTNGFEYERPRTRLDLNVDAQVWRRLHVYVNVNNAFNKVEIRERYAQETPGYARLYGIIDNGVAIVAGVNPQISHP